MTTCVPRKRRASVIAALGYGSASPRYTAPLAVFTVFPSSAETGCRALKAVLRHIELVAPTDATVLVFGESGTNKELIASAIHDRARRQRALVRANCASIPAELFESEFFGQFTGAVRDRVGRFELADGGTFFSMRVPRSDDVAGQALAGAASPRPPRSGPAGHVQLGL